MIYPEIIQFILQIHLLYFYLTFNCTSALNIFCSLKHNHYNNMECTLPYIEKRCGIRRLHTRSREGQALKYSCRNTPLDA